MSARRLNADQVFVVALTILLALTISAASFVLSFHGLRDVATWGRVPLGLAWLVPVMIDAAVLCYTLSWLVQRARRESVWLSWVSLALFIAVSTLGNTLHGWEPSTAVQRVVGTAVVGLAPVAMLLATHTLAQLLTAPVQTAPATTAAPTPPSRLVPLDQVRSKVLEERRHRPKRRRPRRGVIPDASRIAELRGQKRTYREIAEDLGAAPSTVHYIARKEGIA